MPCCLRPAVNKPAERTPQPGGLSEHNRGQRPRTEIPLVQTTPEGWRNTGASDSGTPAGVRRCDTRHPGALPPAKFPEPSGQRTPWSVLFGLLVVGGIANAAVVDYDSGHLGQWIPDDTATGLASTITVPDAGLVASVSVQFELSVPEGQTGWLGDLYAYLRHADGFAVLLNRPGRTGVNPFGYADSQSVQVTFADSAVHGDIHSYRTALNGSESGSLVGALLGSWAPDGRNVDPDAVTDTTPRTALLDGFAGHAVAGDWTLFVADLSGGGQHRLDRWALAFELQSAAVPESATGGAALGVGLLALSVWRWRRPR